MILDTAAGPMPAIPTTLPLPSKHSSVSLCNFEDATPDDILKNLGSLNDEEKGTPGDRSTEACDSKDGPSFESPISLINKLIAQICKDPLDQVCIRDKPPAVARQKSLKKLVFSVLLSHRKDCVSENDKPLHNGTNIHGSHSPEEPIRVNEVESIIWTTYILRQLRKFDEANSLDRCLQSLKEDGHLAVNSDVRRVLRFLVALATPSTASSKKPFEAKLTPRIVDGSEKSGVLPVGPLHYGDTFVHSAEYGLHYMHFPSELFASHPSEREGHKETLATSPMVVKSYLDLCSALPGTGLSPFLLQESQSESCGRVMGALLQKRSGKVTPEDMLSVPELPNNARDYCHFGHITTPAAMTSSCSTVGSDEGYASSRASSRQSPEEAKADIWEAVLEGPPLTSRRTWENLGYPAVTKEKLYLTETGVETSHRVWMVYQQIWGSLGGSRSVQPLYVQPEAKLCQDILHLIIGLPSFSFLWCASSQTFRILSGLCCPGVTPEPLHTSLQTFLECGSYIRRLEVICAPPPLHSQQILTQGLVFRAFTTAIANFLQIYRGKVLSLVGETHVLRLQQKAKSLMKKVKFVAQLCHISPPTLHDIGKSEFFDEPQKSVMAESRRRKRNKSQGHSSSKQTNKDEIPRGLNLLAELHSKLMVTRDRECTLLLTSIFRATCVPFFKYLESWIYEGVCSDPGLEFMIDINGSALLRRDRTYWTQGYTMRDLSKVPPFLREVLQEAYTCGKALNLLKLCAPKHDLVTTGGKKHPNVDMCVTQSEMERKHGECMMYGAEMDHLAAQNQVTAYQREEQLREQKQRLLAVSAKERAAVMKEIERRREALHQLEIQRKKLAFQEIKEEIEKAELKKQEEKENQIEYDKKIAMEMQEMEKKLQEKEEKIRSEMEMFYKKAMLVAEQREALANWKMKRCHLSEARKNYILNYDWSFKQDDEDSTKLNGTVEVTVIEKSPSDVRSRGENINLLKRGNNMNEGLLNTNQYQNRYTEPSPTEESASVGDMTTSLMSTSSDFVETPYDESLPELDTNAKESIKSGNNNAEFALDLCEGRSDKDDENGNMNAGQPCVSDDVNANIASRDVSGVTLGLSDPSASDNNGNVENANAIVDSYLKDIAVGRNSEISKENVGVAIGKEMCDDGNSLSLNLNDAIINYKETRAKAAAIKQKVLNEEFHSLTTNRNTVNLVRSKPLPSSTALENKMKVLETEYGISENEEAGFKRPRTPVKYDRQFSGTSTSSYKTCSTYGRHSSCSTVFTTPDEERPILIDQVGGEVLKERGRSIHGHASDAIIHKLLWKHEPVVSPDGEDCTSSPIDDLLSARRISSAAKVQAYNLEHCKLMNEAPILDITGTALRGAPSTSSEEDTVHHTTSPTASDLSNLSVYFMRSISLHLATQRRLVNASLLSEVLVQESLLNHFSALRSLVLLHDAHFAKALTVNLFTKSDATSNPAALLVPVELNSILNKSVSESCWSTNPLTDNLSFAINNIPLSFTHQTSVLDCLELRYHVRWPHTLILDDGILALYSRIWTFLMYLHHSLWAADDLFHHMSVLTRQDKNTGFWKCSQFHQVCVYRHHMHHFLLVVQAYVTSQVHQISWNDFEQKLRGKVTSLDDLYNIHSSLINGIAARCFLTRSGSSVLKLIYNVFTLMLRFRAQVLAHSWYPVSSTEKMEHPVFGALQGTYDEFKKHATFLHKLLMRVAESSKMNHLKDLVNRMDFNDYYSQMGKLPVPSVLVGLK